MRRFRCRQFVVLAIVALSTWTCSSTSTTPSTTTTTTAAVTVTELFTAQLTPNGAVTFSFTTNDSGSISISLTSISPDSGLTLGMALGVLSGTTCEIESHLLNDTSVQGTVITGTAGSASSFCARVYDAAGLVTAPETISVTVTHF